MNSTHAIALDARLPGHQCVEWTADWIWIEGNPAPRNFYLAARRDFSLPDDGELVRHRVHISAHSHYRLWLNGQWVGDGPARCFPHRQRFETYDVTPQLRAGPNTLAVLVHHYGEGNFQHVPSGRAGLIVQLEAESEGVWRPRIVSDTSWRVARHTGYVRPTMRINSKQPFEEIFDARAFAPEWFTATEPVPGEYKTATTVAHAGEAPWDHLLPREVPLLTRLPVAPSALFRAAFARPANFHFGFTTRPYLIPGDPMQQQRDLPGFAAARLISPAAQDFVWYQMNPSYNFLRINGERTTPGQPVRLRPGENLLLIPFRAHSGHGFDYSYPAFVEQPVQLRGIVDEHSPWTIYGPFADWAALRERVAQSVCVADLAPWRAAAQPIRPEDLMTAGSPFDETSVSRIVPGEPAVAGVANLFTLSPNEPATIHPGDGADPELILDFGREQIGYWEIDLTAPAGTVFDLNGIEEIEDGRRIHYTTGTQNALRYIAREGRQRYTSILRRGFRYLKVTLRQMRGPVRLHAVRSLFSSYPLEARGAFECSDPLLNRIWEVGLHTLRCCAEDTFTDCPLYEQTFWTGDARIEALVDYACSGDVPLTRHCATLPADSLVRSDLVESQVPSAWQNIIPNWSFLWVHSVEEHWQFTGDAAWLAAIYPAVRRMLRNCREKYTDARGLFSIDAWNFFDWAGLDDAHRVAGHNQMLLAESYRRAAVLAAALRKDDDRNWFVEQRAALIDAINRHLWDDARGAYLDALHEDGSPSRTISQQTNTLALLCGVATPERAAQLHDVPVTPADGMIRIGSPFALFFALDALARQERHATALAIVRERWGAMLAHGATTFWETFPGHHPQWWTRSYCHAWSAGPVYFLTRHQLGVWWVEPGYSRARIRPVPLDLDWARGRVPTPTGEIAVAWTRSPDAFTLDIALPPATAATVELPVNPAAYAIVEPTDCAAVREHDHWRVELPAGCNTRLTARRLS